MTTQRDLEEINRQYPSGPDGPRIDEAMRSVPAHPWGNGKAEKPQAAWPERKVFGAENAAIGDTVRVESDHAYLIRLVQHLFVEMAELRTLVASQEDEELVAIRRCTAEADLEASLLRLASAKKPEKWEGLNYLQGQFQVPNLVPDEEKP